MRFSKQLKYLVFFLCVVSALACSQNASAAEKATPRAADKSSQVVQAPHPALFKIANGKSTVYLLGSIHVLPKDYSWRTPTIDKVLAETDMFSFEANIDFANAEFRYFLSKHGYLPPGQTLHKMLSSEAQKQYLALIHDMHIDPNKVDYLQPGVAALVLERVLGLPSGPMVPGVDATITRYAKDHGKHLSYLESLQSEFAVFTAMDSSAQVKMLEQMLTAKANESDKGKFEALLAAWSAGDLQKLGSMDGDMAPAFLALLLDRRNSAWIPKIELALSLPATHLITVGARHLTGANSVIDLLCRKGWKIERIPTDNETPPPACSIQTANAAATK